VRAAGATGTRRIGKTLQNRPLGVEMKAMIVLFVSIVIAGCGVSGHYRDEGPCRGFHKDQDACERAYANSQVIGKVQIGQSKSDVLAVMGKGPERRDATAESESWSYLTQYMGRVTTTITFKNGIVTEIRSSSGRR
jgi:hypothetical protein